MLVEAHSKLVRRRSKYLLIVNEAVVREDPRLRDWPAVVVRRKLIGHGRLRTVAHRSGPHGPLVQDSLVARSRLSVTRNLGHNALLCDYVDHLVAVVHRAAAGHSLEFGRQFHLVLQVFGQRRNGPRVHADDLLPSEVVVGQVAVVVGPGFEHHVDLANALPLLFNDGQFFACFFFGNLERGALPLIRVHFCLS